MSPTVPVVRTLDNQRNPYVGKLADRLLRSFGPSSGAGTLDQWAAIEEMLNYAAEAEQQLSQLSSRIKHLESLSATDPLTGLANRRGFEDFLAKTLAAARRHDERGMMVFIDMDSFKAVNDLLGHQAGDRVLQAVAKALSESTRSSDFVARLGGDEFVVVLVRSDTEKGRARARLLQQKLLKTTVKYKGATIPLLASFGVEPYGPDSVVSELLHRCDRAMYSQKNAKNGR